MYWAPFDSLPRRSYNAPIAQSGILGLNLRGLFRGGSLKKNARRHLFVSRDTFFGCSGGGVIGKAGVVGSLHLVVGTNGSCIVGDGQVLGQRLVWARKYGTPC